MTIDFSLADAMTDQAVAFNLGEHCKASLRGCFNEGVSQLPDTSEGERVRVELYDTVGLDAHGKAIALIATGDRTGIDAIYQRMFLDLRERVRIMNVDASDNPGKPGAGRLHQRSPREIVKPLVGAGRFLTTRGHNAASVEAIEMWLATLPAGADIADAHSDGSVEATVENERYSATLEELIAIGRPASISAEAWREQFPSADDFEQAFLKFQNRQAAEERNATPWGDNGITSRDGRFRSFRDMQS